jgi:hypothetical protein
MSHAHKPVAVPLAGTVVVDGRQVSTLKTRAALASLAPALAAARSHRPTPDLADNFDHVPDFAQAPTPGMGYVR